MSKALFGMPPTESIQNGSFNQGNTGWSGNDLETNHSENAYLGNGSGNRVAEMDGQTGQVTVMEQTITVNGPVTTNLTFDTALRTVSLGNAGTEGFTVEVLDASGTVISTQTVLPTSTSWTSQSVAVSLPSAGDYTVRFTELGPNDSLGAIVDNISMLVCFVAGTRISTPTGEVPVEALRVGDMVQTLNGPRPVRWVGRRRISGAEVAQDDRLRPVLIRAGALGPGLPRHDLRVSRQHRMLLRSVVAKRMFDSESVLVAAVRLLALPGVELEPADGRDVVYHHIMCDAHEVVEANGAASETMLRGAEALKALTPEGVAELAAIFPDMIDMPPAFPVPPRRRQTRLIERMLRNGHQPVAAPA